MKKDILAVCDLEEPYAVRLVEFMQEKQESVFECLAFTNVESLCAFAEYHQISLLLISAQAMCEQVQKLSVEHILLLSEGDVPDAYQEYGCLYKYQASDRLLLDVMEYYAKEKSQKPCLRFKRQMRCIAVYSPVRRSLKTSFALALGQILARERRVLYLNLECFAGFSWLLKKEYTADLGDLLYFLKNGIDGIAYRIQGMTQSLNNLDYLPPVRSPEDIRSMACAEWMTLLEEIERYSGYEVILLDFDETVDGFLEILRHCQRIYMPVREDGPSVAKVSQYEQMLTLAGCEDLMEKTRKLKLPFHNHFGTGAQYAEQLVWSELGDFTKNLIREEFDGR